MKSPIAIAALLFLAACAPKPPAAHTAVAKSPVAVAKGVVEAKDGLIQVLATDDGLVGDALAEEGAHVVAGAVLAQLDDRRARLALESALADLGVRRAEAEVAAARAGGAEREAKRLSALASADAGTRLDADQAATAAAVARGELRQATESLRAAESRGRLAAYEVDRRTIRAPVTGRIVRRSVGPGAYVAAQAPLFVVEPDGARLVRAELDEAFAGKVRPGMSATVTREFQQGRAYGAQVVRVSDLLTGPGLADDTAPGRADARVVNVMLKLPPTADLRLGQRVLVRFPG